MSKRYTPPLLQAALPQFAAELVALLEAEGLSELAEQVPALRIVSRCHCDEDFCATMYLRGGPLASEHAPYDYDCIDLDAECGMVVLDTTGGRIVTIEVLNRPDVRAPLLELLPQRI